MASKAEKKRRKKAKAAHPFDVAPIPRREANGRADRQGKSRDPAATALVVRCKRRGVEPTTEALRDSRLPWWGCEAGTAMATATTSHDDRLALWDAIQHIRRVVVTYGAAIGAPSRYAVCLRLLLPTEAMAVDAETPPKDERSDADKMRAANSAYMAMEGWLGWTDKDAASQCRQSVMYDEPVRDIDGLLSALWCVSDGLRGKKMQYRGRVRQSA